jgi:hypothetical protein
MRSKHKQIVKDPSGYFTILDLELRITWSIESTVPWFVS